jgi:hypothetical protein
MACIISEQARAQPYRQAASLHGLDVLPSLAEDWISVEGFDMHAL